MTGITAKGAATSPLPPPEVRRALRMAQQGHLLSRRARDLLVRLGLAERTTTRQTFLTQAGLQALERAQTYLKAQVHRNRSNSALRGWEKRRAQAAIARRYGGGGP